MAYKLKKPKVTQKEAEWYELGRFDEANNNGERFKVRKNKYVLIWDTK